MDIELMMQQKIFLHLWIILLIGILEDLEKLLDKEQMISLV